MAASSAGCSSLSLSELQTPRTVGQGKLKPRAAFDYGPSIALLYENDDGNRVHRVARAALFPPVRFGLTYGITDYLDVGANVWSAGYWSALAALASWDVGGNAHLKFRLTPEHWRHGLALGFSGFAYAGKFAWGKSNPFEVDATGNATAFNPLILYGVRLAEHPVDDPELYTGLRAFFIDYHIEGEIEKFKTGPPPFYESHDGSIRLISPVVGIRSPGKGFTFFIETGAYFGENPITYGAGLQNFTISFGIEKQ